jgi:hypothetical protein
MGLLSILGGVAGSFFGAPAIGAAIGGAIEGSQASSSASQAQVGAAQGGIDEQRRQFDAIQQLLAPYVQAGGQALGGYSPYQQAGAGALPTLQQFAQSGTPALEQQQALIGLRGPEAQRQAIAGIEGGQQFQAMSRQGENALLQNASATGGLRGGNLQGALAQFRPQLLNELINQQYGRLGGLAAQGGTVAQNLASSGLSATGELARIGQASAAGVGTAGQQTGANIANLLGQQGAARAGGIMGQQQAFGGVPAAFGFGQTSGQGLGTNPFSGMSGQFGNLGAAFGYGTNIGSQQTSMLADQERGMF